MENHTPLIKVCGLREPQNIEALATLPITFMGTIFYPPSPRFSGNRLDTAEAFRNLPAHIQKVGVFVESPLDELAQKKELFSLNYLQLHGAYDQRTLEKARGIAPLIKALGIKSTDDLQDLSIYDEWVDYFIFDTASVSHGGSGKKFDWSILSAYTGITPFLLAGGIGPHDAEALRKLNHPQCVGFDLNSGFELSPALKDPAAVELFLKALQ